MIFDLLPQEYLEQAQMVLLMVLLKVLHHFVELVLIVKVLVWVPQLLKLLMVLGVVVLDLPQVDLLVVQR